MATEARRSSSSAYCEEQLAVFWIFWISRLSIWSQREIVRDKVLYQESIYLFKIVVPRVLVLYIVDLISIISEILYMLLLEVFWNVVEVYGNLLNLLKYY